MPKPLLLFMLLLFIPTGYELYSRFSIVQAIETTPIRHLGIIMDGNRRWAKKKNLIAHAGHQKGAKTVQRLIQFCLERSIKMVSVYAFSLENFHRDPEEVRNIFKIMVDESEKSAPNLIKHGVRVRFIGDKNAFPESVRSTIEQVEKSTGNGTKLQLNVLFCYGSRQEILSAVKDIIKDVKAGKIQDITSEEAFKEYLWTAHLPDPDLIIRTGGVKRLSNFLAYQASYSELYFTDRLWPDLTAHDLEQALQDYNSRKRNFGV